MCSLNGVSKNWRKNSMCLICLDLDKMTAHEISRAYKEMIISEKKHRKEIWEKLRVKGKADKVKSDLIDSGFWDESMNDGEFDSD